MNDARRKRIREARDLVSRARDILEEVGSEERDSFDNLSEGLQQASNGQKSEAAAECLEEIVESLDEAITNCESAAE